MNRMDVLSTLWLIGNLKIKSNTHNNINYERKFHSMIRERNNKRNQRRYMLDKAQIIPKDMNKRNISTTSTPPYSNRRRQRKKSHKFKTAYAYSVENEL